MTSRGPPRVARDAQPDEVGRVEAQIWSVNNLDDVVHLSGHCDATRRLTVDAQGILLQVALTDTLPVPPVSAGR